MLVLTKSKKSPNWYLRGTINGIRVFETTGTEDLAVAQDIQGKRLAELGAIPGFTPHARFTEADLQLIFKVAKDQGMSASIAPSGHITVTPCEDTKNTSAPTLKLKPRQ